MLFILFCCYTVHSVPLHRRKVLLFYQKVHNISQFFPISALLCDEYSMVCPTTGCGSILLLIHLCVLCHHTCDISHGNITRSCTFQLPFASRMALVTACFVICNFCILKGLVFVWGCCLFVFKYARD